MYGLFRVFKWNIQDLKKYMIMTDDRFDIHADVLYKNDIK